MKEFLLHTILNNIINYDKLVVKNSNKEAMLATALLDFEVSNKDVFLVLPNLYEAQKAYEELLKMTEDYNVLFYPADEILVSEILEVSGDFKYERINTIYSMLLETKKHIIVTNLSGALKYLFDPLKYKKSILNLNISKDYDLERIKEHLLEMGYSSVYTVRKTGEFAKRGSIIDIFPLNESNPIRLDFFGDTLDEMKYFDQETQKSIKKIAKIEILPVTEFIYSNDELSSALKDISSFKENHVMSVTEESKFDMQVLNFSLRQNVDTLTRFISFFTSNPKTIFDFSKDKRIYLFDIMKLIQTNKQNISDLKDYMASIEAKSLDLLKENMDYETLDQMANIKSEGVVSTNEEGIDFKTQTIPSLKGLPEAISKTFKDYLINKKIVICFIQSDLRLDRIKEIFLNEGIPYSLNHDFKNPSNKEINIIYGAYLPSFSIDNQFYYYNETSLFEVKYDLKKPKYKSIYKNTKKIASYDELNVGDYVVHFDYGIGKYLGLKTLDNDGLLRDYLQIQYADATFYAPLEQINRIEKYGSDSENITLTKIASKAWQNAKDKVRKKIKDISNELIKLYASRRESVGFKFLPDTTDQVLFEADFPYELTKDQEKAIDACKRDMESGRVMDRLVCGDVGYGKTEVALRCAFKAIQSGKQVALLAPTTILTRQHFYTFKSRMEPFGVNVKLLNRYVKPREVKEILEGLKKGNVDMVIGTHKLLSKDISYKDLGLLIIDEEQRFGVMHKEKIKELKVNVDTITLSATPIPRTLQQSMVGIKELSMIETPPKNRYPIQTYVLERNDAVIRDAILRELARDGQVFYLYNFTEDILSVKTHIEALCPEATVCVGHGKMDKDDLETVISDFIDKKYNVMVCTTIIETGIDIPDTNTLIVHDANRLGLSQLYQLRGRVGRSDRIAYAYMMYEPGLRLTEQALKRLETIREFNELGSGFKIAMKDLAIRGAGDLLGGEQSGFINSIGIETYLSILDEELNGKKEETKKLDISLEKPLGSRHIDEAYIKNEDVRIEIHKKIDKIKRLDDLKALENELKDRFGYINEEVLLYMYENLFKSLSKILDIDHINNLSTELILYMSAKNSQHMDGNLMFSLKCELSDDISLDYKDHMVIIKMDKRSYKDNSYLIPLTNYMDTLISRMNQKK